MMHDLLDGRATSDGVILCLADKGFHHVLNSDMPSHTS